MEGPKKKENYQSTASIPHPTSYDVGEHHSPVLCKGTPEMPHSLEMPLLVATQKHEFAA